MQLKSRTLATVLALTPLVIATPPCVANDLSRAEESKIPIIRVVVDHENHLALIPEGTVLPAGFQITSSMGTSDEALDAATRSPESERPLVFAYAPAERFVGLEPRPSAAGENGETFELRGTDAPEPKTVAAANPCPAVIVVEFGPNIFHQVECRVHIPSSGYSTEAFLSDLTYPSDATGVRFSWTFDVPPPAQDYTMVGTCPVPGDACSLTPLTCLLPVPLGSEYASRATVRFVGACTQDPPYCPHFVYTDTITLPIINP